MRMMSSYHISRAMQANVRGLTPYLMFTLRIVFKSQTMKERGTGIRQKVVGSGLTPKSWNNFLRVNENKTECFSFLAERIASLHPSKLFCVIQGENVLSNNNIDRSGLCSCNHVGYKDIYSCKTCGHSRIENIFSYQYWYRCCCFSYF